MSKDCSTETIEYGDFQTPRSLAEECCEVIRRELGAAATIVEPTCGTGAFAVAAAKYFAADRIVAFEINPLYVARARTNLRAIDRGTVREQDFFACDWDVERDKMAGPVLFLGNPPWVTNSQLGSLTSGNLPRKSNFENLAGIDAITGRSNFDLSEAILQTLISVMRPPDDMLAMLVKTATARRVLKFAWSNKLQFAHASLRPIDSRRHFGVHVDACLLMLRRSTANNSVQVCLRSIEWSTAAETTACGWYDDHLVADPAEAKATGHLQSSDRTKDRLRWRSGVKHDLSRVLELTHDGGSLRTQAGEPIDIEQDLVFPLAKGADVANSRTDCERRRILLPQRRVSDDSERLRHPFPKTLRYLESNQQAFANRKSSIYRSRDRFALFGIGSYTFAPWKVAICGLYKQLTFTVYGPVDMRPVIFDDTSYFLPLNCQQQATLVWQLLTSEPARRFFAARVFWDSKRPITAELLGRLDLAAVAKQTRSQSDYRRLLSSLTEPTQP